MPIINLRLDGDACWPDLEGKEVVESKEPIGIAVLKGGMESGRSSVMIRLDMPDGSVALAQCSAGLFVTAAKAMEASPHVKI